MLFGVINARNATVANLFIHISHVSTIVGEDWLAAAKRLEESLGIYMVGRSRKQVLFNKQGYVIEKMTVDSKTFVYKQVCVQMPV